MVLEKGDKFALPGMITGIGALAVGGMYLGLDILISLLSSVPEIDSLRIFVSALLPILGYVIISNIIVGVIFSAIGYKINRSRMELLGLIFSLGAIAPLIMLFVFPL